MFLISYIISTANRYSHSFTTEFIILFNFRESKVLKRTIQCCALNGGVFWASILIFECGLLPFLKYLLTIIFGHSPGMGLTVWSWTKPFLSLTFGTVWILPLFLLSRIVNSLWFQVSIIRQDIKNHYLLFVNILCSIS